MIIIVHGEDATASYAYLKSLLAKYQNYQKVYLETESTLVDLKAQLAAQNIFGQGEILICKGFFKEKKIKTQDLKNLPSTKAVIFWEKEKVAFGKIKESNQISIKEFKLPATLFYFLDSIYPKSLTPLTNLRKIKDKTAIIWHLANRLMLLILTKENLSQQQMQTIIKKPIAPWQWQKITTQAKSFDENTLKSMFAATLAVDLMKKQGKLEASYESLVALLLIKYLKPSQMIQ